MRDAESEVIIRKLVVDTMKQVAALTKPPVLQVDLAAEPANTFPPPVTRARLLLPAIARAVSPIKLLSLVDARVDT